MQVMEVIYNYYEDACLYILLQYLMPASQTVALISALYFSLVVCKISNPGGHWSYAPSGCLYVNRAQSQKSTIDYQLVECSIY